MQQHTNPLSSNRIIMEWLTGTILHTSPQWPQQPDPELEEKIWQTGRAHGVLALCSYRLHKNTPEQSVPESLLKRLKNSERQAAAVELLRENEIKTVLVRLSEHNIHPLLLKGMPLAYSLYPHPYLRPRCDTDFFFADKGIAEQAWEIVREMGYTRPHAVSGTFVSHEFSCCATGKAGIEHCLDFHWQLSNNHTFARVFSFAELVKDAVQVPALHNVHTPCNVHAILYACMHRLSHSGDSTADRLIWLYDILLLARSLSTEEWDQLSDLACSKQIPATTLDGLQAAIDTFAAAIPNHIITDLKNSSHTEQFDTAGWRYRGRTDWANIQALDNWGDRLLLIKEHLFPAPEYMYAKYRTNNYLLLPLLYLTRIIQGLPKLFK
jgi:hypothetical protein